MKHTFALLVAAGLVVACSKKGTPPAAEDKKSAAAEANTALHSDEPAHEALPTRVRLRAEVIAAARIHTSLVVREALPTTLSLPGELAADPDKSARVSSPLAGRIVEVKFKEGSRVEKGVALAVVRVPELGKVRSAYAATSARSLAARTNADRLAALADKGLAAPQESANAVAEARGLEAEVVALRTQLGALGGSGSGADLTLTAPVSGVVLSRDAVVGQPVGTEQTLALIADLTEVWFLGRVFEKDLGQLQRGAKAEVVLNAYPNEHFSGVVEYIGNQVDTVTRSVTARVRLTNRGDLLRLGLFGSARIAVAGENAALLLVVPRSALAEVGGKLVVFVRHTDDDFEMHEVVLGRSALGKVEVVSGLRAGELVVDEGVFTLKSAVLKSTLVDD